MIRNFSVTQRLHRLLTFSLSFSLLSNPPLDGILFVVLFQLPYMFGQLRVAPPRLDVHVRPVVIVSLLKWWLSRSDVHLMLVFSRHVRFILMTSWAWHRPFSGHSGWAQQLHGFSIRFGSSSSLLCSVITAASLPLGIQLYM